MSEQDIQPLVADLLAAAGDEIALQESSASRLGAMAEAVRAGDTGRLERLLAETTDETARATFLGDRRRNVQRRLAAALGWRPEEVTLGRLVRSLPAPAAEAVAKQRNRLEQALRRVRLGHIETASLVAACARMNRAILAAIVPADDPVKTYGTTGTRSWQQPRGLVDARS